MKKTTLKLASLACASLMLNACGDDAKETVENLDKAPELQGLFLSECGSIGIEGVAGFSKQDELTLTANQTTFETLYYEGTDCKSDKEVGILSYQGEFNVESNKNNRGDIRFELEEVYLDIESDGLAQALSAINFCGQSNIAEGEKQEITENSKGALCPIQEVPATLYGAYSYDDKTNTLHLSEEPTDMKGSKPEASLPLIEVFAEKYNTQ